MTQTITVSDVTAVYGDTDKRVSAETNGDGPISFAVKPGSEEYIDVDPDTGALMIKKAGTAVIVVTAAETDTYAQADKEVTVTIAKAASPAPDPDDPENILDINYPEETVTVLAGYEVSLSPDQPATELMDVSAILNDPAPVVYVRKAGDENHEPSI